MQIYRHETSLTTASGSVSSTTLKVIGGLCRQMLIRANTTTTVFKANVEDEDGFRILDYAYHNGEINDSGSSGALPLPMSGQYTINITNASPDDTFTIYTVIQE